MKKTSLASPHEQLISRREVLNYTWMGSLLVLTAMIARFGIKLALPRFQEGELGGRFNLGPVIDLPSPGDPPRNVPDGKFWLVRTQDHLITLYKACTHLDCMFDWNPQDKIFVCPCHGSRFSLDGKVLTGPAPRDLDWLDIQIVTGDGEVVAQTKPGEALKIPPVYKAPASDSQTGPDTRTPDGMIPPDAVVWVDTGVKYKGNPSGGIE